MPPTLYDDQGRLVSTGDEIGRGGEAVILDVRGKGDAVAKIYHKPLDAARGAKLKVMAGLAKPELLRIAAWPTGILYARPGSEPLGILMPKVVGHQQIHRVYAPRDRLVYFPKTDWSFLIHVSMNCAAACLLYTSRCV